MGGGRDYILRALDNLTEEEFRRFKFELMSVRLDRGFNPIPRGILLSADRIDLSDKIVRSYGEDYGIKVTMKVLQDVDMREEASRLQQAVKSHDLRSSEAVNAAPITQPSASTSTLSGIHFVDKHRIHLINRVTLVEPILDRLLNKGLTIEQYQEIRAESISQNKMRKLYDFMPAWNNECKDRFLKALKETYPYLVEDLEKI